MFKGFLCISRNISPHHVESQGQHKYNYEKNTNAVSKDQCSVCVSSLYLAPEIFQYIGMKNLIKSQFSADFQICKEYAVICRLYAPNPISVISWYQSSCVRIFIRTESFIQSHTLDCIQVSLAHVMRHDCFRIQSPFSQKKFVSARSSSNLERVFLKT